MPLKFSGRVGSADSVYETSRARRMLDTCLHEEWKDDGVLPVNDAGNLSRSRDEVDVRQAQIWVSQCWSAEVFGTRWGASIRYFERSGTCSLGSIL